MEKIVPDDMPHGRPVMSHKHYALLRMIFQAPLPANIHWRELESLLNPLGATNQPISSVGSHPHAVEIDQWQRRRAA
jgi:hypothetical protein